jgi:hypothetical protein
MVILSKEKKKKKKEHDDASINKYKKVSDFFLVTGILNRPRLS